VALRPEDDGFMMGTSGGDGKHEIQDDGPTLSMEETLRQWKLHSPVDDMREALLGLEALVKRKDLRIRVLQNLSNPWPEVPRTHTRSRDVSLVPKPHLQLPEAGAAPIPHSVFRQNIKNAVGNKAIRLVMRAQLLRCERPKEILRVAAVAMQSHQTAAHLAVIHDAIMRALYRCRNHVSDPKILSTIIAIVARFDMAGVYVHPQLIHMGFKFAARARSVVGMQRFLKVQRERFGAMSSNQFRSVIAKFSIGHRGLGEIRNGRWKKAELLQVLHGFQDAKDLPPEKQYHLGTFLDRSDWQFLHGWVAVLARCKDSDAIWEEWLLWKQSEARLQPKQLRSQDSKMNTRIRGDYWFVEQMTYTGDYERAWSMLGETELSFSRFKTRVKHRLLERADLVHKWSPELSEAMLHKYDADLSQIERAFGVIWEMSAPEAEDGKHVLFRDQEEALDELGADDWKPEIDYGFPYDDDAPIVSDQEQLLHDAQEDGLAASGANEASP
jgi:hypothetical protein